MWTFKGKYSGEAKAYIKRKEKKEYTIFSLVLSIFVLLIFIGMAIGLSNGDVTLISIILGIGYGLIILICVLFVIAYMSDSQCMIEITNGSIKIYLSKSNSYSFALYNSDKMEYYDDFIVIRKGRGRGANFVLQKELLIEGDWEELKALLKKVEDSLDSDEPMYQIEEPETEFFEATVKGKRIYQKFVRRLSHVILDSEYQYFITFKLENDEEVEYEVSQELYERIDEEQTGTLVVVNGNFFDFGEGEDIE